MMNIKSTILQAVALGVIGTGVAFVHNTFSDNGINPFRRVNDVPVLGQREDNGSQKGEGIKFISLPEARRMMDQGVAIIDARIPEDYREGHIPGAHLLSYYYMGDYLDRVLSIIPPGRDIIIYCSGPGCEDSEMLARELYLMGYHNLFVFEGGYQEWTGEGLPVEKGEF